MSCQQRVHGKAKFSLMPRHLHAEPYHRSMTDQEKQRLADLLGDAQGALIELEGRLPPQNEDVAGAHRSWERATRAVSDALALIDPDD
jgi:hypothetical protein